MSVLLIICVVLVTALIALIAFREHQIAKVKAKYSYDAVDAMGDPMWDVPDIWYEDVD